MTSLGVAPGGHRGHGGAARRWRPQFPGFWSSSWIAAVIAVAFIMIRVAEFLGPVQLVKPVLAVTLILTGLHFLRSGRQAWQSVKSNITVRLAIGYSVCICLSVPFSIWRGKSIDTMTTVPWALALVALLCLSTPSLRDFDRILKWTAWIAAVTGIALVLQGEVVEGSRLTSRGSYDPNDLGALFVVMLAFAVGAATRGRALSRVTSAAAALVLLVVLLKTGSRGGLIGLVVGMLVFALSYRPRKFLIIFGVVAILGPVSWPFFPPVIRERAASLFALEEDYNTTSNSGRLYLWKRGVVFALANPVVGLGAGTFEVQVGQDFREQGTAGAWHTAHNTYVQVFAELGMLGGTLLLAMLWRSVRNASLLWNWRRSIHRPELLSALAAYMTAIFFLSHGYSYVLWGVLGISAMTEHLLSRRLPRAVSSPESAGAQIAVRTASRPTSHGFAANARTSSSRLLER